MAASNCFQVVFLRATNMVSQRSPYLMDLFQTIARLPKWGYSLSGRGDKCSLYSKRYAVVIITAADEKRTIANEDRLTKVGRT